MIVLSIQESERVANQLKGRAGRQGDPGETHTLLSLGGRGALQGPGRCAAAAAECAAPCRPAVCASCHSCMVG